MDKRRDPNNDVQHPRDYSQPSLVYSTISISHLEYLFERTVANRMLDRVAKNAMIAVVRWIMIRQEECSAARLSYEGTELNST
jgi:hypothetical protein